MLHSTELTNDEFRLVLTALLIARDTRKQDAAQFDALRDKLYSADMISFAVIDTP